jgi:two-component system, OmpR family, phosphate regulon response regulator OmpR
VVALAPRLRESFKHRLMTIVDERVLLIEDDSRLAAMVEEYLGKAGFHVVHADNGARGLALHGQGPVDVVILDLMLPDADGLDICRQIRARSDSPILMLTARGDPMDRVVGLEMGADDYLPKPFEPRELLARLRAILRRSRAATRGEANNGPSAGPTSDVLRHGRLEIDRGAREVRLDGAACALTGYQFALLLALAEHAGRVMSRDAMMDAVKGEQIEAFDRSIDVHVSRIRAAIEDDPKKPRRIITVRGIGYVFAKAQD